MGLHVFNCIDSMFSYQNFILDFFPFSKDEMSTVVKSPILIIARFFEHGFKTGSLERWIMGDFPSQERLVG